MDTKEHNVSKLNFELKEAEHVLASLSLASILMGEYMVIMRVCVSRVCNIGQSCQVVRNFIFCCSSTLTCSSSTSRSWPQCYYFTPSPAISLEGSGTELWSGTGQSYKHTDHGDPCPYCCSFREHLLVRQSHCSG